VNTREDDARAAARLAGLKPVQAVSEARTPPQGFMNEARWNSLALMMLASSKSRIVGVIPTPLLEAFRQAASSSAQRMPHISYYTPRPELALASGPDVTTFANANRWHAGYMGLRNLVMASIGSAGAKGETVPDYHHFAFGIPALSYNCLLCTFDGNDELSRAFLLSELPSDVLMPDFVMSELVSSDLELKKYLKAIWRHEGRIQLREVACRPIDAAVAGGVAIPSLIVEGLAPFGSNLDVPRKLRPVAIVVARCYSPAGLEVLLKVRTPLTGTDDFWKLSLLSARVQEVDVARAFHATISGSNETDETALEDLWIAAEEPNPFLLPAEAFQHAAQREVALSLGLDVALDRLKPQGFQLVQHEKYGHQLGFMVFTLDLSRSGVHDEVRRATRLNRNNLKRIPVATLYNNGHDLNRFLLHGQRWLSETCFT
jgi:hypothetical protein